MKEIDAEHGRPLALSILLIAATIVAGLAVRFAHLGLPAPIVKYGGSALWAVMIYWLTSTLLPTGRLGGLIALAGTAATVVEFIKLFHTPWLDAFRITLAGTLLLGRVFSGWDILVYWLAIGAAAATDRWLRRRRLRQPASFT